MGEEKPQADDVLDYAGLAAYLKIAEGTLRHWVMKGRLPFIKMGSRVIFSRKQIERWMLEHAQEARAVWGKAKKKAGPGDAVSSGELFPVEGKGQQT
jgi:excisionase family DNA binding protein